MNKPMRLRRALLASVSFFTLVPMLVAMAVSVGLFHLETSERIRQENLKVAQTVATAVDLFLARPVVMLRHVREVVNGSGHFEEQRYKKLVLRVMEDDPLFESILFLDGAGKLVGMVGPAMTEVGGGSGRITPHPNSSRRCGGPAGQAGRSRSSP